MVSSWSVNVFCGVCVGGGGEGGEGRGVEGSGGEGRGVEWSGVEGTSIFSFYFRLPFSFIYLY